MSVDYAPKKGDILFKTGVGNFSYDKDVRPHAVTEVENTDGKIPGDALTTSFNDFGKIELIEDAGKNLRMDFAYGPDQQRWYSELPHNGTDVRTMVYAGPYEKVTDNGVTREFYYLDGNTIVIRENGMVKTYLAFTDNLGSILSVMDENGTQVFEASYDAWGKQTVTLNAIGLRLNNPLKYTDPSGDFWNLIIGAAIGGLFNWASHGFQLNAKGLGYFATGAVAGAVGAGLASGVNVAMAGGNFWTGAAGLAKGIASTGFLAGAASGASAGFAGGFIYGAGNSWVDGHSFGKGLLAGLGSGSLGALEGGIAGGLIGGLDALDKGTNFWTGKASFNTTGAMACTEGAPSDFKIGDIIDVKYKGMFEGQYVYESKQLGTYASGNYAGFTLPDQGIVVGDGVFSSGKKGGLAMLQHEFGHVLQYRKVGAIDYYDVIAKESLLNCGYDKLFGTNTHSTYWTETWANYLSKNYFGAEWLGVETLSRKNWQFYYPSKDPSRLLKFIKFGWKGLRI